MAAPTRPTTPKGQMYIPLRYEKTLPGARQHVMYIAFRSRELGGQKGLFDESRDHVHAAKFCKSLDDPLTRERRWQRPFLPKLFHFRVSLSRKDFDACGLTSWKPVVREAMKTFELKTGKRLEWVAAEHPTPTHPHAHVAIKAVYTARDGSRRRLARLTRDELAMLKRDLYRSAFRHLNLERALQRQAEWERRRRLIEATRRQWRFRRDAGRLGMGLISTMQAHLRRILAEQEAKREAARRRGGRER